MNILKEIEDSFIKPPKDELLMRVSNFKKLLESKNIDYALIFYNVNLFYFTNSIQRGCLLITDDDAKPYYFVQKHIDRAKLETYSDLIEVIEIKKISEVFSYLKELGLMDKKRVGLELGDISASFFINLKKSLKDQEIVDITYDILRLRSIKSEFELSQMREASKMSDKIFSIVPSFLKEGMTELELAGCIQAESRKLGNQEIIRMRGFNNELTNPHVLSGISGAIPSAGDVPLSGYGPSSAIAQGASLKKIKREEPIIVDYAGSQNGYINDETRVFVIGKLPKELERAYWISREIIEFVETHVKEGDNGKDVYKEILKIVEKYDLLDHFMGYKKGRVRFVAHGIGLVLNEFPIIADSRDEELKENMVFSIEPKFVFPQKGAVGIEVDFIVKKDRLERLSSFPLDIVSV